MVAIGIAGFGTIGSAVAKWVSDQPDLRLVGLVVGNPEKAAARLLAMGLDCRILSPEELAEAADVVVDTAPTTAFRSNVLPALAAGKTVVTVSAAALIENMDVVDVARESGGRIIMATGALLGLDAVRAAAKGTIHSVTMVTRKPPMSLLGAPEVVRQGVDLMALTEPLQLFSGNAREGARGFPANVNVAAALALAGIGPDRTTLEIWADPSLERNTHCIFVDSDSASFELRIQNIPTEEKPGTGRITALSVIAAVEGLTAPLKIGT
jgi:aspartate dehydrogenase